MNRAFTPREKVLLVILTVLLIGIGYFKLILEPINENIATYQANTTAEQDAMMVNAATLTKMRAMEKELEEIFASGDAKPMPTYDNSDLLLVELNQILSKADDYTLTFGGTSVMDTNYILRRPLSMTFTAGSYKQARSILTALHDSGNVNQITDLSIRFDNGERFTLFDDQDNDVDAYLDVSLTITYYELKDTGSKN